MEETEFVKALIFLKTFKIKKHCFQAVRQLREWFWVDYLKQLSKGTKVHNHCVYIEYTSLLICAWSEAM